MRVAPLVVLCTVAAASVAAQPAPQPGSCALGTATATLDTGVEARIFNTGALFYGEAPAEPNGRYTAAYVVPRGSERSPIYIASLWVGGKVNGDLRIAGGTYGAPPAMEFNFWPGPLGPDARPVNPADCSAYDRIYAVSRDDVARFFRTGEATDDLRDWPWRLGAPVIDGDGDPANYDLSAGDQPALLGDQSTWSLANDVGNIHPAQGTPPLGIELRTEIGGFLAGPLRTTSVYRYTIANRTTATLDSAYVGWFLDPDLGYVSDDYIGTDTTRSMAFVYNADNNDQNSEGYGLDPPAVGFQVVLGPVGLPNGRDDDGDGQADEPGERLGLTSSAYFIGNGPFGSGDSGNGIELYNYLRGRWGDGSRMRTYGTGFGQTRGAVTTFAFPGDPVTGRAWSEVNNGDGSNSPGDKRVGISTGPFRLEPGQSETVTFAIPYGRGASNLASVTVLRRVAEVVLASEASGVFAARPVPGAPRPSDVVRVGRPSPNPFRGAAALRYEMPAGTLLRATLHDALGRRLAVLHDGPTETRNGELRVDGTRLAPGVYRVRIVVPAGEQVVTLVRAR